MGWFKKELTEEERAAEIQKMAFSQNGVLPIYLDQTVSGDELPLGCSIVNSIYYERTNWGYGCKIWRIIRLLNGDVGWRLEAEFYGKPEVDYNVNKESTDE